MVIKYWQLTNINYHSLVVVRCGGAGHTLSVCHLLLARTTTERFARTGGRAVSSSAVPVSHRIGNQTPIPQQYYIIPGAHYF